MPQTITPTQLGDLIVPDVWHNYTVQASTVSSNFWQSGIVADLNAVVGDQLGGASVNMPFLNDLYGDSELFDPAVDLSVNKMTASKDSAHKLLRAKVFGSADIAAALAGTDPVQAILSRFGNYWGREYNRTLIAAVVGATGAMAAAGINNLDLTANGATGAATIFDGEAFIDARALLGDRADKLKAVAVHSRVYALMAKQDLITFIPDSEAKATIPTYMGARLIQDDNLPVTNGTYTTVLFGEGAVGYAENQLPTAFEMFRDPLKGGGYSQLITRKSFVIHPLGIKFTGSAMAAASPTNVELANATNWAPVFEPKNIPIVTLKSKIA